MFASLGSCYGRRPRGPCSEECLMSIRRFSMGLNAIVAIFATTLIVTAKAAQQETVLHSLGQNVKYGDWSIRSITFNASAPFSLPTPPLRPYLLSSIIDPSH